MITLGTLQRRKDARYKPKRIGRGYGSGRGGHESTRGAKGQKARTGGGVRPGFEGGQMPLKRRLPKRGFNPLSKKEIQVVNLERLIDLPKGAIVDPALLKKHKLISSEEKKIKILGNGNLNHALTIKAHYFSASARKKIEEVGGKLEVLSGGN